MSFESHPLEGDVGRSGRDESTEAMIGATVSKNSFCTPSVYVNDPATWFPPDGAH